MHILRIPQRSHRTRYLNSFLFWKRRENSSKYPIDIFFQIRILVKYSSCQYTHFYSTCISNDEQLVCSLKLCLKNPTMQNKISWSVSDWQHHVKDTTMNIPYYIAFATTTGRHIRSHDFIMDFFLTYFHPYKQIVLCNPTH